MTTGRRRRSLRRGAAARGRPAPGRRGVAHIGSERLALIARVGHTVASGLELDTLLQRAADAVHELLGYPCVDIPLVDPHEPRELVVRARGGLYKRFISGEGRVPVARGIMGAAVRERRPQLVNDVSRDPRYIRPTGAVSVRAELAIPIVLGDQVLGVLNVESERSFHEDDVTSLQIIADYVAVAIRNARLYQSAQTLAALQERQRLARDLHDSVTQMLFSTSLIAQSLVAAWRREEAEGERRARRLVELTRSALAEMRALVAELRYDEPEAAPADGPSSGLLRVRRDGLVAALRAYAAEIAPESLAVRFDVKGYRAQPPEREEVLYRVAQEALNNAVRHARARSVCVRAAAATHRVLVEVRDDGEGFAGAARRARGAGREAAGLGLLSMRDRLEAMGGLLVVDTRRGRGTSVQAVVPLGTPA